MAVTPKISVVDKVSYDFFSNMAKRNNCEYCQMQMNDKIVANFLKNKTRFDCFLTRGDRVVGGQGFRTSNPVNYAQNLLKLVSKLQSSVAEKTSILSVLKNMR